MNAESWEIARRSLIDQGMTDFTDGDIIRRYHEMQDQAVKEESDKAKHLAHAAQIKKNAESIQDHIEPEVVQTPENTVFKSWFSKNIA